MTRTGLPTEPVFTGYIRDITERKRAERDLMASRARLVAASDAARRRVTRDLHDGAQQRLVALALTLSRAGERVDARPGETRELLADGERQLRKALEELRGLAAGIRPAILSDAGLGAALESLAENAPVAVTLRATVDSRLPDQVEAAAYFAVCELLANVSKHAEARQTWIDIRHAGGMLRIGVTDNGHGGADPARGTGLDGIERRLAAFDGVLAISSPPGGPTAVTMEIPCALSLPKTSSC